MSQEWWSSRARSLADRPEPRARFADFEAVYGNGEFTFDGLWTVTDPPVESHNGLDLSRGRWCGGPSRGGHLPVRVGTHVFEIHTVRPDYWTAASSRRTRGKPAPSWHCGLGAARPESKRVDEVDGTRRRLSPASRGADLDSAGHILPDWSAVAADYDGVHPRPGPALSRRRARYVTQTSQRDGVTMLRYWGSERTLWFRGCLRRAGAAAEPAASPA